MPSVIQTPPPAAQHPASAQVGPTAPDVAPQTPQEYNALLARQGQLRTELDRLQGQRSSTAGKLNNRINSDAYHAGLESRLRAIDGQILQVDANLARTSQLLAQAPVSAFPQGSLVPPTYRNPPNRNNGMDAGVFLTALSIVFIVFPLTLAFIKRMGRGGRAALPPRFDETPARLERLEQALDTVAVEVERISESQRFMTRLMTETQLGSAVAGVRASAQAAAREAGVNAPPAPSAKALGPGERPFEPVRMSEAEQAPVPASSSRN